MMKKMSCCKLRMFRRHFSMANQHKAITKPRVNEINIQLLSEKLYKQIFKRTEPISNSQGKGDSATRKVDSVMGWNDKDKPAFQTEETVVKQKHTGKEGFARERDLSQNDRKLHMIKEHLQKHKLWDRDTTLDKDVDFQLPPFLGENINEHFSTLAQRQIKDYVELAELLCKNPIPICPKKWQFTPGWTRYNPDGTTMSVDYPDDGVLVFDVEVVVSEGQFPTMATAVSDKCWYSWCSEILVTDKFRWSQGVQLDDLIPLETTFGSNRTRSGRSQLVIGHNVGFDRSFVKEQYYIKKSKLRFLDTMSMHIAVCGLTNFQRVLFKAAQNNSNQKVVNEFRQKQKRRGIVISDDWKEVSTLNNLQDVHHLHVGGEKLDKDPRGVFLEGSTADVRENFQDLMKYCADDVVATCEVFKVLWAEFNERFPHPVTLAGMLEMGTGYLPINQNWERYIHQSNAVYEDMQRESKQLLMKLANDACQYTKDNKYKDDPWLWDLDWTVKELQIKKPVPQKKPKKGKKGAAEDDSAQTCTEKNVEADDSCVEKVLKEQDRHYKASRSLIGYPAWYQLLCPRPSEEDWSPGPSNISSQTRVTPKLLRLTWDGYPLHFDDTHGWGYLVPGRKYNLKQRKRASDQNVDEMSAKAVKAAKGREFPYKQLCEIMQIEPDVDDLDTDDSDVLVDGEQLTDEQFEALMKKEMSFDDISIAEIRKHFDDTGCIEPKKNKKPHKPSKKGASPHSGDGPYNDVNIPGCWFYKMPHKDGLGKRVGNPLAKDNQNRVEDGTLKAQSGYGAERVLKLNKACSYWKNNQKRIESQMIVLLNESGLPDAVKNDPGYKDGCTLGAIVPRIVSSGTITRRAVEPTWLTASNAYVDRVGSELKSMVQAPPGYSFVGADVDSQELWIGAILGDAYFGKTHGCTALGWMTLRGNKKDQTDLHSVVAETVNISRDHAKVFNYGRIYGAGQKFAQKLLIQFNHRLTVEEAKQKAQLMFNATKGKRSRSDGKWLGGSESAMFNKLEEIARRKKPRTPVLGCRISKALEPENVNEDFMTSRINWVVQSSAVDYLHLMLVCMRWLFEEYDIDGRFCISIHDEVRYLVTTEDSYRAALALQITNLLTRSMFAYKLGIEDLPQSVAFFSAVDIDTCLRKEVLMDCTTPSNPHGMEKGYHVKHGDALDIHTILKRTNGHLHKNPR